MKSGREYGAIKVPTSLVSHIICIIAAVAMVVIASIYFTPEIEHFRGIVPLQIPEEWLVSNMAITINIVIMILLTFVISSIANKYSLTTLLSLFPSLFFIMLQCCNPSILQSFNIGLIGATSVLVTTYYLFENYGRRDVEGMVFSTTFILCASTILWDKIIFFIPLFWIGMAQINILSLKSASASLLAIATAVFIFWASSYLGWEYFDFNSSWESIKSVILLEDYNSINRKSLYDILYLIPILIVVGIYNFTNLYADSHEKISIKRYVQFLNSVLLTTLLLIAFNPLNINSYMPIFNSSAALLAAHYFNSIKSKGKLRLLYLIILIYFTTYIVWIL